jgi:hypothetical protein
MILIMGERRGACRGFLGGGLRERDHLENLGVDGRKILKRGLQDLGWGGKKCIAVAQDRDRWRALVNAVMNLCDA